MWWASASLIGIHRINYRSRKLKSRALNNNSEDFFSKVLTNKIKKTLKANFGSYQRAAHKCAAMVIGQNRVRISPHLLEHMFSWACHI